MKSQISSGQVNDGLSLEINKTCLLELIIRLDIVVIRCSRPDYLFPSFTLLHCSRAAFES